MHQFGLCLRLALISAALAGLSACASSPNAARPVVQQVADVKDGAAPVTPPADAAVAPPVGNTVNSTVSELQDLIKARKVNELRTTYNGSYGASLLFKPDDLTYYVALFQQRDFWQVVKTRSSEDAETSYRAFANRTADLARVDFERIRLQAENAKAEKQLNDRLNRLNTLQADHALRVQQDQQVASRQAQMHEEAQRLSQQQQDVNEQLRDLQRQIEVLQAEQGKPSASVGQAVSKKAAIRKKASARRQSASR